MASAIGSSVDVQDETKGHGELCPYIAYGYALFDASRRLNRSSTGLCDLIY